MPFFGAQTSRFSEVNVHLEISSGLRKIPIVAFLDQILIKCNWYFYILDTVVASYVSSILCCKISRELFSCHMLHTSGLAGSTQRIEANSIETS